MLKKGFFCLVQYCLGLRNYNLYFLFNVNLQDDILLKIMAYYHSQRTTVRKTLTEFYYKTRVLYLFAYVHIRYLVFVIIFYIIIPVAE